MPESESGWDYKWRMANRGPQPKGDRSAITVRIPKTHRALYERAAVEAGVPLGDYIALALARAHQLEDPEYVYRNRNVNQEPLPLSA